MKNTPKHLVVLSAGAILYSPAAFAAPGISGEAVFELQLEHGARSDDADEKRTNMFGRVEVAPTVQLNDHFFIDGVAVVEPIQDGDPGEDTFFDNEGVFIEELKLNYEYEGFAVFAGKFNPGFGTAWDYGRGIWSEDFAEDYEVTEKIGAGAAFTMGDEHTGEHTLTASTFFADTSFLSESTGTTRGKTQKADGGVSNTEDFSSFAVSLDGEDVAGIEHLSYHLGYRQLAAGDADPAGTSDDKGYAASLNYMVPFSNDFQSDILLEYVAIRDLNGIGGDKADYYTASIVNTIAQDWNVTVGYTKRDLEMAGIPDANDYLLQLSGGYDFGNGLTLETGWKRTKVNEVDTDILGGLVRYTIEF